MNKKQRKYKHKHKQQNRQKWQNKEKAHKFRNKIKIFKVSVFRMESKVKLRVNPMLKILFKMYSDSRHPIGRNIMNKGGNNKG